LFKFFIRSLLQANVYFICQLPLRLHARVTPDDFFRAFTKAKYTNREENVPVDINEHVDAGSWAYAPTGYMHYSDAPEDDPTMSEADKHSKYAHDDGVVEWTNVQETFKKFIPAEFDRLLDRQLDGISPAKRGRAVATTRTKSV
jgi:hypothetical protein